MGFDAKLYLSLFHNIVSPTSVTKCKVAVNMEDPNGLMKNPKYLQNPGVLTC